MSIFEEEKKRLEDTLNCINEEINKMYSDMKKLSKVGTTLSYEDRLRGTHLQINAEFDLKADNLGKLERALPSPYFGRIDFNKSTPTGGTKVYIGRSGISSHGQTIVTDWRAPICGLYYDSEIGKVQFDSPTGMVEGYLNLKRQINIKDGKLIDVQDSSLVTNDDLLRPYLSTNADNKMKIIIASIQKEQNAIIRRNSSDNMIIQGVAGSGKTSVALHRIAYLIYNLGSSISSDQFLVLGPNNYFLNYISSILPELETSPVDQKTLLDFTNSYLNEKTKLKIKEDEIELLNPDIKLAHEKVQAFKSSLMYKKLLDDFIKNYFSKDMVFDDFVIDNEIIYSKEEILDILFMSNKDCPDFSRASLYLSNKFKNEQDSIYEKVNKKYRDIYINLPKDDPYRREVVDKSVMLSNLIKKDGVKLLKNYFRKIQKSPIDLYKLFLANFDKYTDIDLTEKEKLLLQRETLLNLKKKNISFVDIPAILHLNYLYTRKSIKYKYIVIDEAQDYGLFHFAVLKEIADKSIFSIYGDLAQSIYSYRSVNDWESVNNLVFHNQASLINLNKSYRTTIEITQNANNVLDYMHLGKADPVVRHGADIAFESKTNDINYKVNKINEWIDKGFKSIAVICKTENEAKKVNKELEEQNLSTKYISAKDEEYSGGVFVLTSASAKGLEFDAVMINNASEDVYLNNSDVDMHLLYVASTRALHEQVILYDKKITLAYASVLKQKAGAEPKKLIKTIL